MYRVWNMEMCKGKIERYEISAKLFVIPVVVIGAGALFKII
jgi:hypothetical protein